MARKGILYEQVADAIKALQANHQKITVRAIHAVTGGSMSTVLKHYRRWQSEQLGHRDETPDISPQLMEALRSEMQNYARRALLTMETRMQRYADKLKEAESSRDLAQKKLAETEERLHSLLQELTAIRQRERQASLDMEQLENRLETADQRATSAETELQELRQQTKPRPQHQNASLNKPAPSKPSPDDQQKAFEF